MRAADHQYQQPLAVAVMDRQGAPGVKFDVEGSGYGFRVIRQLTPQQAEMPHTWFLVPGYGAQGATARDVAGAFDADGLGAIVNSSRAIIFAHARKEYRERYGDARWQEAVQAATSDMIAELRSETPAARLN